MRRRMEDDRKSEGEVLMASTRETGGRKVGERDRRRESGVRRRWMHERGRE